MKSSRVGSGMFLRKTVSDSMLIHLSIKLFNLA